MKKRVLLLTLVLCLLLTGCGKAPKKDEPSFEELESNEPMPGFDAQNKYLLFQFPSFQETDGFYFGSTYQGKNLHYYDKSSGVSGFLCADPSCTHDTEDCAAYTGTDRFLSYYDGKLYWVEQVYQSALWRSDLAGTNREKIKPISFTDIVMVYQPQQYTIHRGKLYFWGSEETVVGTEAGQRVTLISTPLDSSEEFTTLYDETFENIFNPRFRFVGNYVYFSVSRFTSDWLFSVTVTKINVNTGESEIVYDEEAIASHVRDFWVTQEGEIYLPGSDDNRSYLWKIEDGKRVEVASWEEADPYPPTIVDGIAVHERLEDGIRWADIVNFSGETIYSGEMFPEKVEGLDGDLRTVGDYGYVFTGGDSEKLIWNLTGDGKYADATIMIDLTDNMKTTVLWTSED